MTPSMRTVVRTRYWMRLGWRSLIGAICLWALWINKYWVTNILNELFNPGRTGYGVLYYVGHFLIEVAPFAAIAGLLLALGRPILRWLVSDPHAGCSKCGYPVPARPGPCPECGLDPAVGPAA